MANVKETEKWEPGIYQLETTDPVMGGEDGIDNLQAKQLANRTLYLKKQIEETKESIPKLPEMPEIPVQSVNGKTGNVEITATDLSALTQADAEQMFLPAKCINDKSPTYEVGVNTDFKDGLKSNGEDVLTKADLPVGIPLPWPTITPPQGWLKCNGWQFDKNKYPKLALAYPNGYLPELRGEFIRGWDDGRGVNPERDILSWQDCAFQNITGQFIGSNVSGTETGETGVFKLERTLNANMTIYSTSYKDRAIYSFDTSRTNRTDSETRPRNIAFMYIVKAE